MYSFFCASSERTHTHAHSLVLLYLLAKDQRALLEWFWFSDAIVSLCIFFAFALFSFIYLRYTLSFFSQRAVFSIIFFCILWKRWCFSHFLVWRINFILQADNWTKSTQACRTKQNKSTQVCEPEEREKNRQLTRERERENKRDGDYPVEVDRKRDEKKSSWIEWAYNRRKKSITEENHKTSDAVP